MCQFIETILINKGVIKNIGFHQRRVDKTTKKHFNTKMIDLQKELLKSPFDKIYRCRITYSKNIENIEYLLYNFTKKIKLKIVQTDLEYSYKYSNRQTLEELHSVACEDRFDDVLITQNYIIKDTSIANIAFFDGISWVTPLFPLLAGTMRSRLIQSGFLKTRVIYIDDIKNFSLFALFNSLSGFYIAGDVINIEGG